MSIVNSVGDLALSTQLRRDTARVNADLGRYAGELSSGKKSDLTEATGGDFVPLAGLERDLAQLNAFDFAASEAALIGDTANEILSQIQIEVQEAASGLLITETVSQPTLVNLAAADTRQRFQTAVSALNSQVAGRAIFSGQAFDRLSLADAETILADLYTVVSAETTVADALTAIDNWFAPGGPFDTTAYQGSATPAQSVRLGSGETAEASLLATDQRIVEPLKALATAAILDLGLFSGQPDFRAEIAQTSAEYLLSSSDALAEAQSQIGTGQGTIERARTRIAAERSVLEIARSEIVDADPFEAGTRLQTAQIQLETIYTITSRLSTLSLVNFLR